MRKKLFPLLAALFCLSLLFGGCNNIGVTTGGGNSTPSQTTPPATSQQPILTLDPNAVYYADILMKDHGTITVKLDQKAAPITVANFVKLASSGFYNGLTFHRIMDTFMMQGGDPEGTGYGGSQDTIYGEFAANGYNNPLPHTRGAISMARANNPNSASSQFFIVHTDKYQSSLDGLYACFGYVTEGMEIVDAICAAAKPVDGNGFIAPAQQPVMTSVTIRTENAK